MAKLHRYVAFLRAVNVGGRTLKMDLLRELVEGLRFSSVETFIASGNVAFETSSTDTRAIERRIEKALHEALGFEVETFVRTPAELAAAVSHDPFGDGIEGHTLSIGFLGAALSAEACRSVAALGTDVDDLCVHGREVYWRRHTGMPDSKVKPKQLERALGGPSTMRNVTTIRKLVEKYPV